MSFQCTFPEFSEILYVPQAAKKLFGREMTRGARNDERSFGERLTSNEAEQVQLFHPGGSKS
jgi:hypothetical protein